MNKPITLFGALIALLLTAQPCFSLTLKLAHAAPKTDLQQQMSVFFKQELEARSKGKIKVNIFPQGQLGNDKQMIDGTRAGIIDLSMVGLNNWTGLLPESAAFTLPYMFPGRASAYRVLDGPVGQEVLTQMEKFKVKGLGFPENGYRNMTNNRGPIRTPEDLKGLRMRVNTAKSLSDLFNRLGANPQQIPIAELYNALETGVVDAQDHPTSVTFSFRFNEVQRYFSVTEHAYSPLVLTMNMKRFQKLSPEHREILLSVAKDAIDMQRQLSIANENSMIEQLAAAGMQVNRDVDAAAFRAAAKPVWESFIKAHGDELVTKIEAAIGQP